jgi:hypothetical protein
MIDIRKIADLVLLMIDASFGFEVVRPLNLLPGGFYCVRPPSDSGSSTSRCQHIRERFTNVPTQSLRLSAPM